MATTESHHTDVHTSINYIPGENGLACDIHIRLKQICENRTVAEVDGPSQSSHDSKMASQVTPKIKAKEPTVDPDQEVLECEPKGQTTSTR